MPRIAASHTDSYRQCLKNNSYARLLGCSGSSKLEVDCLQIRYLFEDLATTEVTKVPRNTLTGQRRASHANCSPAWCRHAGSEAPATPSEPA